MRATIAFGLVAVLAATARSGESVDWTALVERGRSAPVLLFTREKLEGIRRKVAADPDARAWWQAFRKDVSGRLDSCSGVPDGVAQWLHWYTCRNCATLLKTESPTRHVCPKCKAAYSGWPYDEAANFPVHTALGELIRDGGIAWSLSGDRHYADKVRELLLGYAKRYLGYPRHDNSGTTNRNPDAGHVFSQVLDESVWLITVVQGYDAIRETLTEEERREITEKLLRPAADIVFARDDVGKSVLGNHQCWHFSAYALVAIVTGDAERLRQSVEGLCGCRYQLKHGVLSDGFWYEGAWGYHFYTMNSLLPYFVALANLGVRPPASYKALFDAPFGQLTPDWKLPAMNDSGRMTLKPGAAPELYEAAWTWWRDPTYANWLKARRRDNRFYALWGTDIPSDLPSESAPTSRLYEASGVAILREGGNYLALDYGPHGGWHGHFDKLNLLVWAKGRMFAEDPGGTGYGNPLHWGWYKSTAAHNTVGVDGKSQLPADGRLLAFGRDGRATFVVADAGAIAKGVRAVRATALVGDVVLDLLRVTSESEHLYEWTFHSRGERCVSVGTEPVPVKRPQLDIKKSWEAEVKASGTDPWLWTKNVSEGSHDGRWNARWTLKDGRALGLFQRSPAGRMRLATGLAHPAPQTCEVVANRVRAKSADFVTVLTLDGSQDVEILPDGDVSALVNGVRYGFSMTESPTNAVMKIH